MSNDAELPMNRSMFDIRADGGPGRGSVFSRASLASAKITDSRPQESASLHQRLLNSRSGVEASRIEQRHARITGADQQPDLRTPQDDSFRPALH